MSYLRYKICAPVRILLPISGLLFVVPFVFEKDSLLVTTMPLSYFLGLYFFLINFPGISESIHTRPLYIEDLKMEESNHSEKFQKIYTILMNFLLASLFAGLAEYMIIQNILDKPLIEALGIIGGNLGIYYKLQRTIGGIMIALCHKYQKKCKPTKTLELVQNNIA